MKKDKIQQLQISHFNYTLPDEKIAKYPLEHRDASKLLLYRGSRITSLPFADLPGQLPDNSLLLFNNTRVIHARLLFRKETGAHIEVFCLSPLDPADYALSFQQRQHCSWKCMIGNARRWKSGPLTMDIPLRGDVVRLTAQKTGKPAQETIVDFSWNNGEYTFSEILEAAGKLPIPPYLNRPSEAKDDVTYQTVYSRIEGSVAAPTAGLHFTPEVLERIRERGIQTAEVTLHVGAGTFKPVKSGTVAAHEMHSEFISVPVSTIDKILNNKGSLIVVGTTSMRTLESLYYIGRKLHDNPELPMHELSVNQWEPYENDIDNASITPGDALRSICHYLERTHSDSLLAATRIIIVPGYEFHYPDALITNFHQPQSTLLLLIAAFVGDDWRKIYDYALNNYFRFLSYGDSSLLWKKSK